MNGQSPEEISFTNHFKMFHQLLAIESAFTRLGLLLPDWNSADCDYPVSALEVYLESEKPTLLGNARFYPGKTCQPARIIFGAAGRDGVSLAQSMDFVVHEFAHGILWTWLSAKDGEAGILHEGLADFLTYLLTDDSQLGEDLAGGFKRTAIVADSMRYDSRTIGYSKYTQGQVLSALLWSLYRQDPSYWQNRILQSVKELQSTSTVESFLVSLQAKSQGAERCQMVFEAGKRGMETMIDYTGCPRYQVSERDESRDRSSDLIDLSYTGCSLGKDKSNQHDSGGGESLLILMLFPLFIAFQSRFEA